MLKDENYINIGGWMINRLNLKGNELLTYAIIHGFSQDGETWYKGSIDYIAEVLQISRPTAIKALESLVEQELIFKRQEKTEKGMINRYRVNLQAIELYSRRDSKDFLQGGSKDSLRGVVKKFYGGSKDSLQGGSKEILHKNNNTRITNRNTNKNNKRDYFPLDEKLNDAFNDFLDTRKKMRKPNTDRSIDLQIKKLEKLSADSFGVMDNDKAIKIIKQSIEGEWLTFYPLKDEKQKQTSGGIDWSRV